MNGANPATGTGSSRPHVPASAVRAAGRIAASAIALGLLAPAACQPSVATHGRGRDVTAAYRFRTLEANLGPEVGVLTVRAAAEQSLRARGYVVTRSDGDDDRCRVEARTAGMGDWDRVVVESWVDGGSPGTSVSVRCEPWGDEKISRAVLDGLLVRLGR